MPRHLPLIAWLTVAACAPPRYVPPSPSEPHAVVTLRVLHHEVRGTHASHQTTIDGHAIDFAPRTTLVRGVPMTQTLRVRPILSRWRFSSSFSHTVSRLETVMETERYACGTTTTGSGLSSRSSTRYCSRQVSRRRWRNVTVSDGSCEREFALLARAGHRYMVQFDYYASGQCRARCFVRETLPGGRFRLHPCNRAPARSSADR